MLPVEVISERILTVRGKKVILASDLADMGGDGDVREMMTFYFCLTTSAVRDELRYFNT